MESIGGHADKLDSRVKKAGASILGMFEKVAGGAGKMAAAILIAANSGAAISALGTGIGVVTRAAGGLGATVGIVRNAAMAFGILPRSTDGFPNIVKRAIQVAAAVRLFSASTSIISRFAAGIPLLARFAPAIRGVGDSATRGAAPLLRFARAALLIAQVGSALKTVTALAKGMALLTGGIAALGGVIYIITGLASAIAELSGVAGLLPAVLGVVALAMGTLKLGLKGVGDAFKALASGDMAKFDEALKKLAPSARAFMQEVKAIYPAFKQLQLDVQQKLFDGLAQFVKPLAERYLPLLRNSMMNVATSFNIAAKDMAAFLNQDTTQNQIGTMLSSWNITISNVTKAFRPLLQVLLDLGQTGGQVLAEMTRNTGTLAQRFADFVRKARDSGKLAEWMRDGVQAAKDLGAFIRDVGVSLKLIFTGLNGGEGQGFLKMLREGAAAMRAFLESTQGQEALRTFGEFIGNIMTRWLEIFRVAWEQLSPAIAAVMPFIQQVAAAMSVGLIAALHVLGPMLTALASTLSFLAPVLAPIIGALLGFGIAAKGLLLIFGMFGKALNLLILGFRAVGIAWKVLQLLFLTNPWVALITAIIALVIIIITNWDTIKEYLAIAWEWIKSTAETVWNAIVSFFTGIWAGIVSTWQTVWGAISTFFTTIWNTISTIATTVWTAIVGFFAPIWDGVVTFFKAAWDIIVGILTTAWEIIWGILRFQIAIILAIFFTIFNPVWEFVQFIWNQIVAFLQLAWQGIVLFAQTILMPIIQFFIDLWTTISTFIQGVWQTITDWLSAKWWEIVALALSIWQNIVTTFNTVMAVIQNIIMTVWNVIWGFLGPIWNTISTAASTAWNIISNAITTANNTIFGIIQSVWNSISGFFSGIWSTISGIFSSATSTVMNVLQNLWSTISNLAGSAMNLLVNAGRNIVQGLWNGIAAMGSWLYGQIMGWIRSVVPGPILQFLGIASPSKWMRDEIGKNIPAGIMEGMKAMNGKLIASARTMTEKVAEASKLSDAQMAQPALQKVAQVVWTDANQMTGPVLPSGATPAGGGVNMNTVTPPSAYEDLAAATGVSATTIQSLVLDIKGNLDPTNQLEFKRAIDAVIEGIRKAERSKKQGSST